MQQIDRKPLFDLGQLVATPGALAVLEKSGQNPMEFLTRHVTSDWGEITQEDRKETLFIVQMAGSGANGARGKAWRCPRSGRRARNDFRFVWMLC